MGKYVEMMLNFKQVITDIFTHIMKNCLVMVIGLSGVQFGL